MPIALDVACGTGQSSLALTAIAQHVIGVDVSRGMLSVAHQDPSITYVQGSAEALPFPEATVPLITVGLAFDWFDSLAFLDQAARVLEPDGVIATYNNGFTGRMVENESFKDFTYITYPERYPTPPRNTRPIEEIVAWNGKFEIVNEERFENEVSFIAEELCAYLTTQSNVIAAVEQGRESLEDVYAWLIDQVQPYFVQKNLTFVFATLLSYLRKK